jgi:transcriptional regulator with GAF, ATPase, and Fis domain
VWHFVRQIGSRMGKSFTELHGPCQHALEHCAWPGNVRELRNVVERAMILADGPVLRIPPPVATVSEPDVPITLDEDQRRHILGVLQRTGWKVRGAGGAAAILGINCGRLTWRCTGVVRGRL